MNYRRNLFFHADPYDAEGIKSIFLEAVKENVLHHINRCIEYKQLLDSSLRRYAKIVSADCED